PRRPSPSWVGKTRSRRLFPGRRISSSASRRSAPLGGRSRLLPRFGRVAVGALIRRDQRAQPLVVLEPGVAHRGGDLKLLQCIFENFQPPRKLSAHDRVLRVRQIERTARVFDGRAEKPGRELVFHLLYSAAVGVLEEESDHPVLEHAIDKNPY